MRVKYDECWSLSTTDQTHSNTKLSKSTMNNLIQIDTDWYWYTRGRIFKFIGSALSQLGSFS